MDAFPRTVDPLDGLTTLQINALAHRFCDGPAPTPLRIVGERLGTRNKIAVSRLIRRGLARIAANGYSIAEAFPGAVLPGKERNTAA